MATTGNFQDSASPRVTTIANTARRIGMRGIGFFAATVLLAHLAFAQARPKVASIDPTMGKADDTVTLMGENLTKDAVAGVFLSDETTDHKATVTEQAADKIVIKVPAVKAGSYNISIQEGDQILILPLRFTVQ